MEVQKTTQRSFSLGDSLKHTDPPSNCLASGDEKNITRPVGVFKSSGKSNLGSPKSTMKTVVIHSSISITPRASKWILRSSGRRKTIVSYLFHKWLFSSLTKTETHLFFDLREVTTEDMIYSALRARMIGTSLKTIRKVLKQYGLVLFGQKPPSVERWNGYRTFQLSLEHKESQFEHRRVKRYSGWKRHQNDHGSLGPPKEDPFYLEPSDENDNISLFLTICKAVSSGESEILINNTRIKLQ